MNEATQLQPAATFRARLTGTYYIDVLRRMHETLKPSSYFEIGCYAGQSLALAKCATLAVDPSFEHLGNVTAGKPSFQLFQMTSDAFFKRHDPAALLGGAIELAFLDGMHWWEFLLRDFMNTERACRRNSVIAMHDCLPTDVFVALRENDYNLRKQHSTQPDVWAGDVWKTVVVLKKYRPDLRVYCVDAAPTGLVLVTNLDPASTVLDDRFFDICREFEGVTLASYGLDRYFAEVQPIAAATLNLPQDICARFWL